MIGDPPSWCIHESWMHPWENALFSFLCQRLWSGETVRKVTLVENSADYEDSNDDSDDSDDDDDGYVERWRLKGWNLFDKDKAICWKYVEH